MTFFFPKKKKKVYKKGFRAELVFLLCTVHWSHLPVRVQYTYTCIF